MPMFTTIESTNRTGTLVRIGFHQRIWTAVQLNRSSMT